MQHASLFNNIPKTDYFHFFKGGSPEPKKVLRFLDYKKQDLAVLTGVSEKSIRFDERIPKEVEERMREWALAINLVGSYFQEEEKTMLWFQTQNPLLGNLSPRDMIRLGRFKKLLHFIQSALAENER